MSVACRLSDALVGCLLVACGLLVAFMCKGMQKREIMKLTAQNEATGVTVTPPKLTVTKCDCFKNEFCAAQNEDTSVTVTPPKLTVTKCHCFQNEAATNPKRCGHDSRPLQRYKRDKKRQTQGQRKSEVVK